MAYYLRALIVISCLCLASCTTKHVVILGDPVLCGIKADYSATDLALSTFSVRNMSSRDRAEDVGFLKRQFIEYVSSKNQFRSVHDSAPLINPAADTANWLLAEVQVVPNQTKERTYLLDIPFFYPCCGYWPLTPLWGKVSVDGTLMVFDNRRNLLLQFVSKKESGYSVIFYSWYRTSPVEEVFADCYHQLFEDMASCLARERDHIVAKVQPKAAVLDARMDQALPAHPTGQAVVMIPGQPAISGLEPKQSGPVGSHIVVTNTTPQAQIAIALRMEDDPAKTPTAIGNGDGIIQRGEAFDLVVTVTNTGPALIMAVKVDLIVPQGNPLTCFSKPSQPIGDLAAGASSSLRFNLALPLRAVMTKDGNATIVVKTLGTQMEKLTEFIVPIDVR